MTVDIARSDAEMELVVEAWTLGALTSDQVWIRVNSEAIASSVLLAHYYKVVGSKAVDFDGSGERVQKRHLLDALKTTDVKQRHEEVMSRALEQRVMNPLKMALLNGVTRDPKTFALGVLLEISSTNHHISNHLTEYSVGVVADAIRAGQRVTLHTPCNVSFCITLDEEDIRDRRIRFVPPEVAHEGDTTMLSNDTFAREFRRRIGG